MDTRLGEELYEGSQVRLETTRIFSQVESVTGVDNPGLVFRRSLWDKLIMLVGAVLFFVPLAAFSFAPRPDEPSRNMTTFALVVAPSYIASLIALGLWVKLLLVHFFGAAGGM